MKCEECQCCEAAAPLEGHEAPTLCHECSEGRQCRRGVSALPEILAAEMRMRLHRKARQVPATPVPPGVPIHRRSLRKPAALHRSAVLRLIQEGVAEAFGLSIAQILTRNKRAEIVRARHVAQYMCWRITSLSMAQIGRGFRGEHHTTILHVIDKLDKERTLYPELDAHLTGLEQLLKEEISGASTADPSHQELEADAWWANLAPAQKFALRSAVLQVGQ